MGVTATVLGASGYTGGELLRLLAGHPALAAVACSADRRTGQPVGAVHPHLAGSDAVLVGVAEAARTEADVCFSCLPPGALGPVVNDISARVIVDLSDEHRDDRGWVYGLTEFARPEIAAATRIANPGCYPTATLLGAIPFARAGVIGSPVVVDAISGVSGAGRKLEDRLLFASLAEGVTAYGTTPHRHVPEMERALEAFGNAEAAVSFTPHLAPIARGLVATIRAPLGAPLTDADALQILRSTYSGETFVTVVEGWPTSKAVTGSNHAHVSARVDARAGMLIAASAIDNLGKGAAGQAIQNANLALGLEEDAGLTGLGVWP